MPGLLGPFWLGHLALSLAVIPATSHFVMLRNHAPPDHQPGISLFVQFGGINGEVMAWEGLAH